jgi:hypothetical protein
MHGPTCVFWANLTPFSLSGSGRLAVGSPRLPRVARAPAAATARAVLQTADERPALLDATQQWAQWNIGAMGYQVTKMPCRPRSWANFSLF